MKIEFRKAIVPDEIEDPGGKTSLANYIQP
jgi:hypothetical protein